MSELVRTFWQKIKVCVSPFLQVSKELSMAIAGVMREKWAEVSSNVVWAKVAPKGGKNTDFPATDISRTQML